MARGEEARGRKRRRSSSEWRRRYKYAKLGASRRKEGKEPLQALGYCVPFDFN